MASGDFDELELRKSYSTIEAEFPHKCNVATTWILEMPKPLLQRFCRDCVYEFRRAAQVRFDDGISAAQTGRRSAAVYLSGYAAEMTLKAAYFHLLGFAPLQPITMADLRAATLSAPRLGFVWAGKFHDLHSWSQLLVATRAANPGWGYANPAFGIQVLAAGTKLQALWSETIRYHGNVPYSHEVSAVTSAAEWLLINSHQI
jgi:hypothetical protein